MVIEKNLVDNLIADIRISASLPIFIHYAWFVNYHLEIVEKIALELCTMYPNADKNLVRLLVWFHDYGKIVDFKNQYESTLTLGKNKLTEIGFSQEVTEKVVAYMKIFDAKENIANAPIEIQIVSSADGASHLIGPFFLVFWKENPKWTLEELLAENKRKATVDWEKKIVLPEIKEAFLSRYKHFLECCGELPKQYLS